MRSLEKWQITGMFSIKDKRDDPEIYEIINLSLIPVKILEQITNMKESGV